MFFLLSLLLRGQQEITSKTVLTKPSFKLPVKEMIAFSLFNSSLLIITQHIYSMFRLSCKHLTFVKVILSFDILAFFQKYFVF